MEADGPATDRRAVDRSNKTACELESRPPIRTGLARWRLPGRRRNDNRRQPNASHGPSVRRRTRAAGDGTGEGNRRRTWRLRWRDTPGLARRRLSGRRRNDTGDGERLPRAAVGAWNACTRREYAER
jgi:hypothetical protein